MRAAAVIVLALLALVPAAPAGAVTLPDVEDEVMCVQCGTALNISAAPSADRMRAFIRRRIDEGMSKQEIKDALVAEYGPRVLATPSGGGIDFAAWLVPVLLALAALGVLWTTVRRWRRAGGVRQEPHAPEGLPPSDARRLDEDMAGYDL